MSTHRRRIEASDAVGKAAGAGVVVGVLEKGRIVG
jgi:hypothetical protein